MKFAPLFAAGLLAAGLPARAQEQLVLDPPLGQAFPLEAGPEGVHVRCPVLLNDHTVVRPDAVLRFIYLDPQAGFKRGDTGGDESGGDGPAKSPRISPQGTIMPDDQTGGQTHGEGPGTAWGPGDIPDSSGIFDHVKKDDPKRSRTELESEKWPQKEQFVDALDHAAEMGTTLVYRLPGQTQSRTAGLDLPEGLLLGELDGHVRVLSVAEDSRAHAAGIRAGDDILGFDNDGPVATLDEFMRGLVAAKERAHVSGRPGYALQIRRGDSGETATVQIAPPPTIPSFF